MKKISALMIALAVAWGYAFNNAFTSPAHRQQLFACGAQPLWVRYGIGQKKTLKIISGTCKKSKKVV